MVRMRSHDDVHVQADLLVGDSLDDPDRQGEKEGDEESVKSRAQTRGTFLVSIVSLYEQGRQAGARPRNHKERR